MERKKYSREFKVEAVNLVFRFCKDSTRYFVVVEFSRQANSFIQQSNSRH